jgi:hypothetical protein
LCRTSIQIDTQTDSHSVVVVVVVVEEEEEEVGGRA